MSVFLGVVDKSCAVKCVSSVVAKSRIICQPRRGIPRQGMASPRRVQAPSPAKPTANRFAVGRRVWLIRIGLVVLTPVLFLAILEIGLSIADFGRPATFFVASDQDGILTTNHWFIWFYRKARTTSPHPCLIRTEKPANTIRVFVLGESAAMGTPNPAFSFGRILAIMLQSHFPDHHVEVVNAAMRGINSHIVALISRECAQLQPDLFLVYMGNNEIVGRHGPTTFLCQHPKLIPALQRVKETRFFQGLRTAIQSIVPAHGGEEQPQTMAFFRQSRVALDDPRREATYRNYRRNLTRICENGHTAGASVVVATVPVNLQDFPPLASLHRRGLTAEQLSQWQSLYDCAVADEERQWWVEAISGYKRAAGIDDHYADLHFRMARCLMALGDRQAAKEHFSLARDWDALQFRTDSRLNSIVREVASTYADRNVHLADLDASLTTSPLAPNGVAGDRLFNDHVHYSFDGGYELAKRLLPTVVRALQKDRSLVPAESADIPSRDECAARLAFTPWDQMDATAGIAKMLARPPFLDQIDHSRRQARFETILLETKGCIDQAFVDGVVKSYDEAIRLNPNDWTIRYNYANFLYQLKRYPQATGHIQYVVNLFGDVAAFRVLLGYCLAGSGCMDQSVEQFRKARQLDRHSKPIKDALAWALQLKRDLSHHTPN